MFVFFFVVTIVGFLVNLSLGGIVIIRLVF
jgi:hypothetical protein